MTRLLWLSNETPDVYGGGGQRRQFHQICSLVRSEVEVVVVTLAGSQSDSSLRPIAPVYRFEGRRWRRRNRHLERLLETIAPTRALLAHVESAQQILPELKRAHVPFLVDFHNVVSRWHETLGEKRMAAVWRKRELEVLVAATHATACSAEERTALLALGADTPVEIAPHGIAREEWPSAALRAQREPILAMFGSWRHEPNRIAAEWLTGRVWPRVRQAVPPSRLLLVGPSEPPSRVMRESGVEAVGRVSSLAETLGNVRVAVVPIQRGIGARVKFIESLASGAAVVSTTVGSEGFVADGSFILADEPNHFADACIRLLREERRAADLGRRGRDLAFSRYTWDAVTEPIRVFARGA